MSMEKERSNFINVWKVISNISLGSIAVPFIIFGCIFAKEVVLAFKLLYSVDEKMKRLGVWVNFR